MTTKAKTKKATTPKAKATKASKATATPAKKLSQLDAAARVLAKAGEPMNCKQIVESMAKQKLWTSPAGKTPDATLYAAMMREITTKGKEARFKKADRGLFAKA